MAHIMKNSTARSGKTDIEIQGGLKTDAEIEKTFHKFVSDRGFRVPNFVLYKIKQAYYNANLHNQPDDVLVEDVGYWNEK